MPNRSRIGCLDDLGNSISIVIVTYYTYTPSHKITICHILNIPQQYIKINIITTFRCCSLLSAYIYKHLSTIFCYCLFPPFPKHFQNNNTENGQTMYNIIYIYVYFTYITHALCTVQGILNKDVIVIIATCPQYYYICFTIFLLCV